MGKVSVKGEIPNSLHPQWVSHPPRFNGSHDELLWHLPLYKSQALFLGSHHFRFSPRCQFIASTCHALQQIKPPINGGNRRLCPGQNLPRTLAPLIPDICHFFTLTHFDSWKFYTRKVRKFTTYLPKTVIFSFFLEFFYTQPKILHSRRSWRS